jgi:hypothetical protein
VLQPAEEIAAPERQGKLAAGHLAKTGQVNPNKVGLDKPRRTHNDNISNTWY